MKKIIIILLLLPLLFLIIKIVFSIRLNQWTDYLKIPDFIQWHPPDELTPPIYGEKSIRQGFRPNFNGLTEIALPFVWENGPVNILLSLYKGRCQEHLIFEREFSLTNLREGEMFRFRFKPIAPSKDEYFLLAVKAPEATARNNLRLYYSQRLFHISCRGPLYFDSQKAAGELSLIINCRYDIRKGIFTWPREKMKKDKLFFLSFGVILFGVLGAAILYTISLKSTINR